MSTKHGFTEEDLAGLSKQEREALEAEPSESETYLAAGGPGIANVDPGADPLKGEPKTEVVEDEKVEGEEGKEAKAAKAADDKAAEGAEKPAGEGEAATEDEEADPLVVPFQAQEIDPELVKVERDKIEDQAKAGVDAVMKKYDDGDIDQAEMLAQRDRINAQKMGAHAAIDRAIHEAEIAEKHEKQTRVALWKREIDSFMGDHPVYQKDADLKAALNRKVKEIAGDPANDHLKDREVLVKAHEEMAKKFKVDTTKAEDPAKAAKDKLQAVKDKRAPDLKVVPPTLSGLPAAAPQNADTDEFAHLDNLAAKSQTDADAAAALELAVARMTPEQQDRWARS